MTVDKSQARIRRMFGEIAPRYDLLNHLLTAGLDVLWRWWTVRAAGGEGSAVLDVCTGTGDLALAFADRRHGAVVGSDFSCAMLRKACGKAIRRRRARSRPVFVAADTLRLPFRDETFGVVSVAFGLRNVGDTEAGLREMARVCRPGGTVVVLECTEPANRVARAIFQVYFRQVVPRIGRLLSPNRFDAYAYLPASVAEFPHGDALAELMRRSGLVEVVITPLTLGTATLYVGRKPSPRSQRGGEAR